MDAPIIRRNGLPARVLVDARSYLANLDELAATAEMNREV